MSPFPTPVSPSAGALPVDSTLRKLYPDDIYPNGNYYSGPYGKTRYWIIGPEQGKKVVLIHGITTPCIVWKESKVADILAAHGFRVLLYDLYGRGYSDAPQVPHDPNLYAIQLALLLQYLRWDSTDVVGFSLGGAIAAAFGVAFPHLVTNKIVFVAAAGLLESPDAPPSAAAPPPPEQSDTIAKIQAEQKEHLPHFTEVLLSCRREGLVGGMQRAYEIIGKSDKQFCIIHGTSDQIVPFTEAGKIRGYIPQAKLVPIEGATHYLLVEGDFGKQVADSLVEFLS